MNGPRGIALGLALAFGAGLLLIRLTPLGGALFALLAILSVATVIEPLASVGALLFLGPLWAYLRAEVPQIPAQIAQVFVALTLAVWLARGLLRRDLRLPHPPLLWPLLGFMGAALLSLWDSIDPSTYGALELLKWIQVLLLFLFVYQTLSRRRVTWLVGFLLTTGFFQAGVGLWQFGLRGDGPEHFAILQLGEGFYRAYGTFEQPNPYAGYLALTASLAVGVLVNWFSEIWTNWFGSNQRQHATSNLPAYPYILLGGGALAMLLALGASWSRGGWIGFSAAILVMIAALPRNKKRSVLLVSLIVVGGLGVYATGLLPASIATRLTDFTQYVSFEDVRGVGIHDANYAVVERMAHWQAALEMLRYNFWTGVGFGCYEPAYTDFALINWPIALGHAHNYYLNIAAETGVVGLIAYLFLWGAVFWQTWRVTCQADGLQRGLSIGLLGTWTHLSVHHLFDNLYVNNVHLHIGVMLGLLAWLIRSTTSPCLTTQSRL